MDDLPEPNARFVPSGHDLTDIDEAGVRGMICNPIYAGVGAPALLPEKDWIAAARKQIEESGPQQFFVNMLYVLREMAGEQSAHLSVKSKFNPLSTGVGYVAATRTDAEWIELASDLMFRNGVERFLSRMLEELRLSLGGEPM
jgi:hypothetical protein